MPHPEIARLYRVTERYRPRGCPQGCPHCVDPKEGARLAGKTREALSGDELSRFAFKAMTTFGDADDFRYFLPRLLELVDEGALVCDTEVLLGKLALADWQRWPAAEREATMAALMASWRRLLDSARIWEADAFLCGLGAAVDDLTPFLRAWDEVGADEHFAAFVERNDGNETPRKLKNAFWKPERAAQERQILEWATRRLSASRR